MFIRLAPADWRNQVWAADDTSGGSAAPATAEPVLPSTAGVADGGGGDPAPAAADAAQAPPAVAAVAPAPKAPAPADWRDKRIAQLTAKWKEAEGRASAAAVPAGTPPAAAALDADLHARAAELATKLEAEREFNRRCNDTAEAGRTTFGEAEFNSRVTGLQRVVDMSDPQQVAQYNLLLDAVIETGAGPQLIHELGDDPNEAARLMALPPARLGIELARRAAKPEMQLTRAPKPVTPVAQRGGSAERIDPRDPTRADNLSTAEWMARRDAQVRERQSA